MIKICSHCNKEKDVSFFNKDKTRRDGFSHSCKECKRSFEFAWRERNRIFIREQQREFYKKNSELISKKRKEKYDPIKSKARWLAKKIDTKTCIFCNKIGERHHPNYSHPLDVVFLCKSHHKQIHDGTIKL